MRRTPRIATTALVLGLLFGQGRADAADAKTFFKAGAAAYESGQYLAAVQAFEEAFRLSNREGIIFSIAQAYRRQYYLDKRREHLEAAIKGYRDYLARAPEGPRKSDAAVALAELEAIARQTAPPAASGSAPAPAPSPVAAAPKTRFMISSSTPGVMLSLDGGQPQEPPLIAEVKPGKHRLSAHADGYHDEERELAAVEGGVVALDLGLREKAATLLIDAAAGAEIAVDGRVVGEAPIANGVSLPAGGHFVSVSLNGHHGFAQDVELGRGEERKLPVDLSPTGQRTASYVVMATGAAGLVAGGVLTGIALYYQRQASDIDGKLATGSIQPDELGRYNEALEQRDEWRRGAGIALAGGAAVGLTGVLLYAFDRPTVPTSSGRERPATEGPTAPQPTSAPGDLAVVPLWLPSGGMGVVRASF